MRVSTKSRFAVNAMIDLALRQSAGPVALASISQRQKISLSYLEQLFSHMRRVGLVESTRGPGGGYTLGRDVADITVADIVMAVDEPMEDQREDERSMGMSRSLWQGLHATMLDQMAGISLQSLVREQQDAGVQVETTPRRRPLMSPPPPKAVRSLAPNSVFAFGRSFAA